MCRNLANRFVEACGEPAPFEWRSWHEELRSRPCEILGNLDLSVRQGAGPRDSYVRWSQPDAALRWLSYGIQTGKGMLLVTGGNGCGKTLLSRRLIVGFSPARYDVAFMRIGQQELCRGNSAIEPADGGPRTSGPFTAEAPTSYITARTGAATEGTGLLIKEARAVMYAQGKRIARLINAHCDQCLSGGAIEHVLQIDDRLVQRVGQVL
jgi:type II secretory pathway predicted ATPase ExeA